MVKKYGQLKEGEVYTLIVTEVNFSKECELIIWAQPELDETLDYIAHSIQDAIPKRQQLLEVKTGSLCLCQYTEDGDWYRACIETQIALGKWKVCFVDFGNHQVVDESLIYQMPPHLSELPGLAIKLVLDGSMQPLASAGLLSSTVAKAIVDVFLNNKVDVFVTKACEEGFYEIHCNAINTLLAQRRLVSLESSYPYSAFPIGEEFQAYVSEVTLDGTLNLQELKSSQNLDQLMDAMREYYSYAGNVIPVAAEDFAPGSVVAAVFNRDSAYYRAQIASVDGDLCTVRYIDYGNFEKQTKSSIFVLPSQFCDLNYQAISCKLHDVHIPAENHSKKLRDILFDQLSEQLVDIKISDHCALRKLSISGFHQSEKLGMLLVLSGLAKVRHITPQQTYKYTEIEEGSFGKAIISHVEPNGVFYVTKLSEASKIDQLSNNLAAYCSIAQPLKRAENSMPCCALDHKDNNWYRAMIKHFDKESATVYYVDFGNTIDCNLLSLRPITEEFLTLTCQAVKCSILRRMTAAEIEKLHCLVGEIVDVKFLKQEELNCYTVKLLYNGDPLFLPSSNSDGHSQSDMKLQHCDPSVVNDYQSDSKSVQNGTAVSLVTDENFVQVAVCFIEDPDCMWFQQLSNDHRLFKLIADMNLFYGTLPSNVLCFQELQFDNFCCVRIVERGKENWHRGRILCLYGDVVEVKLIDFGNEVKVKQSNIKILTSPFLELEAQALKCKLYNIKPSSEQWSVSSIQCLFNLTKAAKKITARFVEKQSSAYAIDLFVDIDDRTFSVNERLVHLNHAVWLKQSMYEEATISQTGISEQSSVSYTKSSANNFHKLFYQSPGVSLVGAEIKVIAAEVESPDDFFLKINNSNHYDLYAKLTKDVHASCAYPSSDLKQGELYIGMPCCVFYDKLKQWCRGALLNLHDSDNLEVCLVDEGCIIHCALSNVRSISAQFVLSAPPAAMRCTSRGIIASTTSNWTLAALNLTQNFFHTNYRNLSCTIHGCTRDEVGTYFICDVRSPLGSLANELVDADLAVRLGRMGQLLPPLKLQSFIYSNFQVVKGKEALFHITHVENSNLFYSQLAAQIPGMNSMLHDLQQQCMKNDGAFVTPDILAQECVCFAKFNGKQWNRAHFVASEPNGFVKVMFVDRGNTEIVHLTDVQRFANERFFELPIQALPCSLEDVDVSNASSKETQLVLDLMRKLLLYKHLRGVVAASTSGKLHLDVFEEGKRVNDIIMSEAMLKSLNPSSMSVDKSLDLSEATGNCKIVEPSFLRSGVQEEVVVSECVNPRRFYVQFQRLQEEQRMCENAVDGFYTAKRNSDYLVDKVFSGNVVCARRGKDMKWCRAVVLSVSSDIEVQFIDSGKIEKINHSYNIKQLLTRMDQWPKMAIACSLAGVKPTSTFAWSSETASEFRSIVQSAGHLKAQFLKKDDSSDSWLLKLCDGETDIASRLVDMGLADYRISECQAFNIEITPNEIILEQPTVWSGEQPVYISHVMSSSEVCLQSIQELSKLDVLMFEVNDDFKLEKFNLPPKERTFCFARYDVDNQLYRAFVEKVIKKENSHCFLVKFVDYGNTSTVNLSDLRKISKNFSSLPQVAIPCTLSLLSTELTSNELFTRLKKLSVAEDVSICASLKHNQFTDLCTANLKIKPNEQGSVSLYTYLSGCGNSVSKDGSVGQSVGEVPNYVTMKNVLEHANRQIYISHVENPGHVYCQFSDFCDDLDTLMDSVEVYYNVERKEDKIDSTHHLTVDSPCIAKYQPDGKWYRAKVDRLDGENKVKVRFVDYGNSELLPTSDIRKTKIGFCVLPVQAVCCFVAGVNNNSSAWSVEEIDAFDERVASLRLRATFSRVVDEKKNIFEVMLRLPDGTLLNNEYMKNTAESQVSADEQQGNIDYVNDGVSQCDNSFAGEAVVLPDANISSQLLHDLDIKEGMVKECYVSHAKTPANFYLQLSDSESDIDSLSIFAAEDGQADETDQFKLCNSAVGSYCVVQNPEDGEWCRGKIIETGETPTVFFVDYGDTISVGWSDIKAMSKQTAAIPIQSISCHLADLPEFPENSVDQVVETFLNTVMDDVLTVKFLRNRPSSKWEVELTIGDTNVAEKLSEFAASACVESADTKEPSDPKHLEVPPSEKLEEPAVFTESMLQDFVDHSKVTDIEPGTILIGEVVYAFSLNSFYVKLDHASLPYLTQLKEAQQSLGMVDQKRIGLKLFLAKRSEEENWKHAVVVKKYSGDSIALFIDDGVVVECDAIYDIQKPEKTTKDCASIFHCRLSDVKSSDSQQMMKYFIDNVLRKKVCVTFLEFDSSSFLWVVDLAFINNEISVALQNKASVSDDMNAKDEHQGLKLEKIEQPIAASTPALPTIVVTGAEGLKHTRVSDFVTTQEVCTNSKQLTPCSTSEDWLSYCESVCSQVKDLLLQAAPTSDIVSVVDGVVSSLDMRRKCLSEQSHAGDGDAALPYLDDHKRASSAGAYSTSPCKRRKLEKYPKSIAGTSIICSSIPEDEVSENPDEEVLLPDVDVPTDGCYHTTVAACIENPHCFYLKPSFIAGDLSALTNATQICDCDQLGNATILCAFQSEEKTEFDGMKRGIVLTEDSNDFCVLDVDTGFKYTLGPDKLFQIPEDLKLLPPLAVNCTLSDVSPFNEEWSAEACDFFSEQLEKCNGAIFVKFLERCGSEYGLPKWAVCILIDETPLTDLLIKKNYASSTSINVTKEEPLLSTEEKEAPLDSRIPLGDLYITVPTPVDSQSCTVSEKYINLPEVPSTVSNLSDSVFTENEEESPAVLLQDISQGKPRPFQIYHSSTRTPTSGVDRVPQFVIPHDGEPRGKENQSPEGQDTQVVESNGEKRPIESEVANEEQSAACAEYGNKTYVVEDESKKPEKEDAKPEKTNDVLVADNKTHAKKQTVDLISDEVLTSAYELEKLEIRSASSSEMLPTDYSSLPRGQTGDVNDTSKDHGELGTLEDRISCFVAVSNGCDAPSTFEKEDNVDPKEPDAPERETDAADSDENTSTEETRGSEVDEEEDGTGVLRSDDDFQDVATRQADVPQPGDE